jgi:hypothetical protein
MLGMGVLRGHLADKPAYGIGGSHTAMPLIARGSSGTNNDDQFTAIRRRLSLDCPGGTFATGQRRKESSRFDPQRSAYPNKDHNQV